MDGGKVINLISGVGLVAVWTGLNFRKPRNWVGLIPVFFEAVIVVAHVSLYLRYPRYAS
jgi:hypothetical protein